MYRRNLIAAAPAVLALGACSTAGTTPLGQVTSDAQLIASGLQAALGAVASLVPANVSGAVNSAISAAQGFLKAVSGVATTTAAQPLVQQLISALEAGLPTVLPLVTGPLGMAIEAALVLLPAIGAEVGLLIPGAGVPAGMSVAQARGVLSAK